MMDPASISLDRLHDVVEPNPVSWWPPAIGWWVLASVMLLTLVSVAIHFWKRWRANAFRRAALAELEQADSVASICEVLKRTALSVSPRAEVASLTGRQWCEWLGSVSGQSVPPIVAERLISEPFQSQPGSDIREVAEFAANWIRRCPVTTGTMRASANETWS